MKAAILGTTGYTGLVLLRLLKGHPKVDTILPASSSSAGTPLLSLDPGLSEEIHLKTHTSNGLLMSVDEVKKSKPDIVFSALPHLASATLCKDFFGNSIVIDLSADFRIKDRELFRQAYGEYPPREDLLSGSQYGLCEIFHQEIKGCDIIANPGCYPTASLLPLIPLVKEGVIEGSMVINALSGISGAGKKTKENLLFCERTENTGAYSPGTQHRHWAEIADQLGKASDTDIVFTPHLVPLKRGMAVTTVAGTVKSYSDAQIMGIYLDYYKNSPFIRLRPQEIPQTSDVWGSNRCDIGWQLENGKILLFSVIDNLMKGASGQAVQTMNIRLGLEETLGLPLEGEL
jgi:N-acetyl-gamma-glutamyl-phosphate reductase